ncbi:MAG: hypothetical protein CMJ81_23860 [Planctomycetaceae bacterium]|nr:hypothetical protein [Planctomycetaceae bacterium]
MRRFCTTENFERVAHALVVVYLLVSGGRLGAQETSGFSNKPDYRWPPRVIYCTDGNWVYNYLTRRDPQDLNLILNALEGTHVDAVSVLVGIDDDLSWRGSPHGELFGDATGNWNPDGNQNQQVDSQLTLRAIERLHRNMVAVIDDGHDLMQIYISRGHAIGLGMYGCFRMNDAHASDEKRSWSLRSHMKKTRPDLLLGSPSPTEVARADQWNFCWQWDYAHLEVRERFLGLFDETLTRYDFDGLELDFCRGPDFFKPGQRFKNIPAMTEFMRRACGIVRRHEVARGKPLKLVARVPCSIDHSLEAGLDIARWIEEGLADVIVMASPYYANLTVDVDRAVKHAKQSEVLVYTGFDSSTYTVSPQGGYERNPETVLRAVALNGYKRGATGVHVFNFDYENHRPGPVPAGESLTAVSADPRTGRFTEKNFQTLRDLADPLALRSLDRCYYVDTGKTQVDHPVQLPRKLALNGRGAASGHTLYLDIEDDLAAGLASGRIKNTELRLRLTDHEQSMDRVLCEVNDYSVNLHTARTIANSKGQQWLVLDNPPVREGRNRILLVLDGIRTPDPWPSLRQCEVIVKCQPEG